MSARPTALGQKAVPFVEVHSFSQWKTVQLIRPVKAEAEAEIVTTI